MTTRFIVRAVNQKNAAFEMVLESMHDVDIVLATIADCNRVLDDSLKFKGHVVKAERFVPENGDKELVREGFVEMF